MLKRSEQRRRIVALLENQSLEVQRAFLDAVAKIVSSVVLAEVIDRLEADDIAGAVEALHIDRSHLSPVLDAIFHAYREGGELGAAIVDGRQSFDAYELFGRDEVHQHATSFLDRLIQDMTIGIGIHFGLLLAQGMTARRIALSVVGVTSRATGTRVGGTLGLTAQQREAVAAAQRELSSGDAAYLRRGRRDKRFDKSIRLAVERDNLDQAEFWRRVSRAYSANLLQLRAQVLGRTEAGIAVDMGAYEGVRQAATRSGIDASLLTKTWISQRDYRVRSTHRTHSGLDGQTVPFDGIFHSHSGATLKYPRDPSAPAQEIVMCRCFLEFGMVKR